MTTPTFAPVTIPAKAVEIDLPALWLAKYKLAHVKTCTFLTK